MLTWLLLYSRYVSQTSLHLAESGLAGTPEKKGLPVLAIILIVIGVIICLLPVCIIAILALMGPAVGNVFSEIIMEL